MASQCHSVFCAADTCPWQQTARTTLNAELNIGGRSAGRPFFVPRWVQEISQFFLRGRRGLNGKRDYRRYPPEAEGTLAVAVIFLRVLSAALDYLSRQTWPLWSLGGLASAVVYVSYEGLWGYLWRHVGMVLLLPLPIIFAGWLAVEADDAMQKLRSNRTCRRQ
jgi:hypothetical protein